MSAVHVLQREIEQLRDPVRATQMASYFKVVPGGYGEGDQFLGIAVPDLRALVKRHAAAVHHAEAEVLLMSPWHEARFVALQLWVTYFATGDEHTCTWIYEAYLANTERVNNWDLVDSTAPFIVGPYLASRDRSPLDELAASDLLLERRIAMIATLHFIRNHEYGDALRLATSLLHDEHDLMHKAVGWMLREIGNRDREVAERHLQDHYRQMSRTMLRYAIERFEPERRQAYLRGLI